MDAVTTVERALAALRKNEGITLTKLSRSEGLRAVFGEVQISDMYQFICDGLDALRPGWEADATRAALNIRTKVPHDNWGGAARNSLTARREKLAKRWGDREVSAVRHREQTGMRELSTWMCSNTQRLLVPDGSDEKSFVWACEDTTYLYRGGALHCIFYQADIRSLLAGLGFIDISLPIVLGDRDRFKDNPYFIYGCQVPRFEIAQDHIALGVQLSRALHFGEVHRIFLQIDIASAGDSLTTVRTPLQRRERAVLRLQFDKPLPASVHVDGVEVSLDEDGYFWRSWEAFGGSQAVTTISYEK